MRLIAVTGGIGSGKSVVCRILSVLGYDVYDCDGRAKAIMDHDEDIKKRIAAEISPLAVDAYGNLDRALIASVVFNDKDKLQALNGIVHEAVRTDLSQWREAHVHDKPAFVETAILYQSGLDRLVDEVWDVYAPDPLRIRRVCLRNNLTPSQVEARISSQAYNPESPHPQIRRICNDDCHSLLLQISQLLNL